MKAKNNIEQLKTSLPFAQTKTKFIHILFGSDVWNLLHPFPQKIALKLKSIDSCKFKISYIAEKAKENFWTLDNMYKSIAFKL